MPEVRPKPKVKVGDRMVTIGAYGLFNSKRTDFKKIAADIYASNYTGLVVHIMSPWTQVPKNPRFPWPWDGKQFDLSQDNSEYYAAFQELLDVFEWYGLDLMISLDDVYYQPQWVAMTKAKLHPYLQNNVGLKLGNDKGKYIFDSIELPAGKFNWLGWKIISEPANKYVFSLVNPLGKPRARWIGNILDAVAKKRQTSTLTKAVGIGKRTWRVFIRGRNEEYAAIDPATGSTSHAKSVGDRSEVQAYLHDEMEKRGLTPNGRNLFAVVNRDVQGGDDADRYRAYTVLNRDITAPYGVHFGMGALHEVHIDGVADRNALLALAQFRANRSMFSTDGCPKVSAVQYIKANRDLYLEDDPYCDILYEDGKIFGWTGNPYDTMNAWNKVFPFHAQIVK